MVLQTAPRYVVKKVAAVVPTVKFSAFAKRLPKTMKLGLQNSKNVANLPSRTLERTAYSVTVADTMPVISTIGTHLVSNVMQKASFIQKQVHFMRAMAYN